MASAEERVVLAHLKKRKADSSSADFGSSRTYRDMSGLVEALKETVPIARDIVSAHRAP